MTPALSLRLTTATLFLCASFAAAHAQTAPVNPAPVPQTMQPSGSSEDQGQSDVTGQSQNQDDDMAASDAGGDNCGQMHWRKMMGGGGQWGDHMRERAMMMGMGGGRGGMMMHGPMMRIMFAIADQNGDGELSFDEIMAVHKRIFDVIDANKDGKISLDELRAFGMGAEGR